MAEKADNQTSPREGWEEKDYLNDAQFVKFLGKRDDFDSNVTYDASDYEGFYEEYWEKKEIKENNAPKIKKALVSAYVRKFRSAGIKVHRQHLRPLEDWVDKLEADEPDELLDLQKKLEEYESVSTELDSLRKANDKFKSANIREMHHDLQATKVNIPKAPTNIGTWMRRRFSKKIFKKETETEKQDRKGKQGARELALEKKGLREKKVFEEYGISVDQIEPVAKNIDKYLDLKGHIFEAIEPAQAVLERVRIIAREQIYDKATVLRDITDPTDPSRTIKKRYFTQDLSGTEKGYDDYEKMKESDIADLLITANISEGMTELEGEILARQLKTNLERRVEEIVTDKVQGKSLVEMESMLKGFVDRESIGDLSGTEANVWKAEALGKIEATLTDEKDKMKLLFVRTIKKGLEEN